MKNRLLPLGLMLVLGLTSGCGLDSWEFANTVETPDNVEVERFMGPWYVIENIPTALERGAVNAIEEYTLRDNGDIDTRFTYRKWFSWGPRVTMNPKGWVKDDADDARWVMTFFNLPYEFAYLILAVDENYEWCAVGGPSEDMLWIMSRTPTLSQDVVDELRATAAAQGYDISKLKRVPQIW